MCKKSMSSTNTLVNTHSSNNLKYVNPYFLETILLNESGIFLLWIGSNEKRPRIWDSLSFIINQRERDYHSTNLSTWNILSYSDSNLFRYVKTIENDKLWWYLSHKSSPNIFSGSTNLILLLDSSNRSNSKQTPIFLSNFTHTLLWFVFFINEVKLFTTTRLSNKSV